MQKTEAEPEAKLTAKALSKAFKIVCAAGIMVCALLKWLNVMPNATAGEICMIWSAVYGVGAGTIDLNIMFDKFTSSKGERNEYA